MPILSIRTKYRILIKLVSKVLFIKWVGFYDHMLIIYVSISYVSWKYEVKREKGRIFDATVALSKKKEEG